MLIPMTLGVQQERLAAAARRASEALLAQHTPPLPTESRARAEELQIGIDASGTMLSIERLQKIDFEQMSSQEMMEAVQVIANLKLDISPIISRHKQKSAAGRFPDWRATMRRTISACGEVPELVWQNQKRRWPSLVVLCDILGSMSVYSRIWLRFLHAVTNRSGQVWSRVYAFAFGTQLTSISRHLANCDVDVAL